MIKNLHYQNIITAITEANQAGFIVCASSDPEGNSAHTISPLAIDQYAQDQYNDKYILLAVNELVDEDELNNI